MSILLAILIAAAVAATVYVLVRGVMTMAQGNDVTGARSQDLMRKRVLLQAVAIVLVVLFLLISRGSGN